MSPLYVRAAEMLRDHRTNRVAYEDGTNRLIDTIRLDSPGVQYERHHVTLSLIGAFSFAWRTT
jgi:hypothetical protein